ncbi:tripartite motif-containing protein 2-like [Lytechinus variegatus]|uniref:tripartite motif-containing protein 2-like n=1 Tax=Lytechinus variegatus TaxID=7654 RepID=UPI001BB2CBED|nr:tripartite motif-containing protein 2-like [Lytechinus variegatus]
MASLNTLLDSVVSEEVECAICLNKLDTPRILSCLHSFCEKCLEKCIRNRKDSKDDSSQSGNSSLKCALCKEYTALPDSGVRGLRLDFRATRLVEALQEQETRERKLASSAHRCEACGCTESGETASTDSPFTYCRECCQVLCQRCSAAHAGLRLTQSHTVAKISDLLNGKVTIQSKDHSMLCPKHADEKLKIFCVTCLEPVCHDCTLIDHNREQGHQLQFLKDFIPTIREELSSRTEEVTEKSGEFSEFLNLVDDLETHIIDKTKTTSKSIQNAVVDYSSRVEEVHFQMEKVACDYLGEKTKQLNQLRRKTQHIKSLAEKSLSLTQQILENEQDLVGLASMYKSLREAMDRAIAEKPDEQKLKNIRKSIDRLHYHVTPLEAKIGKVSIGCSCRERSSSSVACKNGPKDVLFTRDGRMSAIVQAECIGGRPETVYVKTGTETLYKLDTRDAGKRYEGYYSSSRQSYSATVRGVYEAKDVKCPAVFAAIKQTATSFPNCTSFSWTRWLPTLQYDSIRCFTALSDHRFIIATTDAKLYILGDALGELSHDLPVKRSISGLATDNEDNIYITDRDNHKIFILRSDGNLKNTLTVEDISPTCIAVPHMGPEVIAVAHEPATVSVLDHYGNSLCSIHNEQWKKVAIGCDADRLLYILWSDRNNKKTLQRYTFQGMQVDTLFEKESHSYTDLVLAVSPTGACAAAVVTTTGVDGKVATVAPREKPSPEVLP